MECRVFAAVTLTLTLTLTQRLIYELDPYLLKMYTRMQIKKMNFLRQGFQNLSYYIHTYIHTVLVSLVLPTRTPEAMMKLPQTTVSVH